MIKRLAVKHIGKLLGVGASIITGLNMDHVIPDSHLKYWLAAGVVLMTLSDYIKNDVLPEIDDTDERSGV